MNNKTIEKIKNDAKKLNEYQISRLEEARKQQKEIKEKIGEMADESLKGWLKNKIYV